MAAVRGPPTNAAARRERTPVSKDLDRIRRLEAITAKHCPAEVVEDEESAGLRAAWLALGTLLEANQAQMAARSALSETSRTIPTGEQLPQSAASGTQLQPSSERRFGRRRTWLLAAVPVGAAAVLLALAMGWHARMTVKPTTPVAPEQTAVKAPLSPSPSKTPQTDALAATRHTSDSDWDDSTDQTIELIGRATIQVEQDELASTGGSSSIIEELDAVRKHVNDNSDFSDSPPSIKR